LSFSAAVLCLLSKVLPSKSPLSFMVTSRLPSEPQPPKLFSSPLSFSAAVLCLLSIVQSLKIYKPLTRGSECCIFALLLKKRFTKTSMYE
jgi:hypothetical protein